MMEDKILNGKESDSTSYRLFLDMDGVLVDFEKGMKKRVERSDKFKKIGIDYTDWDSFKEQLATYYNTNPEHLVKNPKDADLDKAKKHVTGSLWKLTRRDMSFWSDMEWMSDGKELWNYCLELKSSGIISQLNILSSPSTDPTCKAGKEKWLIDNGLSSYLDRIIIEKEKFKFCDTKKDILVDDTPSKLIHWENKGGISILHITSKKSIKQLSYLFNTNYRCCD